MADTHRTAGPGVEPLFLDRWSPRALDGSSVSQADLDTLFDAARWAPSAYNVQPWRFVYARREDTAWATFLDLLVPQNRVWAERASAILFVLSDTLREPEPGAAPVPWPTAAFDTGAAWMLLALQATRLGLVTHGMAGYDGDRARVALGVPDRFRFDAAVAVGRLGDPSLLPDALRAREVPSDRKPLSAFTAQGRFSF